MYFCSNQGGEFMHSSQFSVTMWQAVTVLVCWSVLCVDCLIFIVLLGWILSKIVHCVEFSGAHVLDHRIYITWKISRWTRSIRLSSCWVPGPSTLLPLIVFLSSVGGGIHVQITRALCSFKKLDWWLYLFMYVYLLGIQIHNMILFLDGNDFVYIWVLKCELTFLNFFLKSSIEHTRAIGSVLWSLNLYWLWLNTACRATFVKMLILRPAFQQNSNSLVKLPANSF